MRPIHWPIPVLLAILITPALSQAPSPVEMAMQYVEASRQNAEALKHYSWKMRIEITIKGEPKPPKLYQFRYDMDGKLQKTLLTAAASDERARGIRGRIKAKKTEEFREWADDLADLVKDYTAPSAGTMLDFYTKAKFVPEGDAMVKASAEGFIQPKDTAAFWLDKATRAPSRFAFTASLGEDLVKADVRFAQVKDGPRYAGRTTVEVPSREVQAIVETFDYIRQ